MLLPAVERDRPDARRSARRWSRRGVLKCDQESYESVDYVMRSYFQQLQRTAQLTSDTAWGTALGTAI